MTNPSPSPRLDADAQPRTYDEELIAGGQCPELVPVFSDDFGWGDGRCLADIVPGGFACPGHTEAIEAWRGMSEEERAYQERADDLAGW